MNCKTGIIAVSLLISSLAGPARAELSQTAAAGEETAGHPLSAPENDAGQAVINSFLERFAGVGFPGTAAEEGHNPSIAFVPTISETTLFTAFTRAASLMHSYYSRSGTDNGQAISAISQSGAFVAAVGGDRFVLPEAGLAAAGAIQGHFVGSGAVMGEASIAPIQNASSEPVIIQSPTGNSIPPQGVPLPLPFLLTGSGLASLLALRKRAGNNG
jgi:hypothetical protein